MTGAESHGYERRIGRYGGALGDALIAAAGVRPGQRVLDVGCGAGALTLRLAELLGPEAVAAVDPDPGAVAECSRRLGDGADVRVAPAEELPYPDGHFDAVLAQLVVAFMDDAEGGVREMRRVAREGAPVATCVWDFAGGMTALRTFWDAAAAVDPEGAAQYDQAVTHAHSTPAGLRALWESAGLEHVTTGELVVGAGYSGFDDLWEPLTLPDGAPGRFFVTLDPERQAALEADYRRRVGDPAGPFRLTARAWYALGSA